MRRAKAAASDLTPRTGGGAAKAPAQAEAPHRPRARWRCGGGGGADPALSCAEEAEEPSMQRRRRDRAGPVAMPRASPQATASPQALPSL